MFKFVLVSALVALARAAPQILPRLDGRIVGGQAVKIEDYPHQLSLQFFCHHICGASIISQKWAVTAAHCTDGISAESLTVRAGTSTLRSAGVVVQVQRILQNPQYDLYKIDYDISVLELSEPLTLGNGIQPIALPTLNENVPAKSPAICSGWGATMEGGSLSSQLQAVSVEIVSLADCKKAYNGYEVTDRMVCAGVSGGGKDACQGDSGGPLTVDGKLIGIVSWGYGCALPEYPGVYSSVPNMRGYINETAGI